MKKRLLVLFAKGFPYNFSEPFLENEYPLYKEYFDKVLIITGCTRKEQPTRIVTDPTVEILRDFTLSKDVPSILGALPWTLTDRMLYRELKHLFRVEGFSIHKLYDLFVQSLCANHMARQALRWMKKHPQYQAEVIYAYWMKIPAYGAIRLNQKLKGRCYTVSRVHRYDLYVERCATGYVPFHGQIFRGLDEVASISEDGRQYLSQRYGQGEKISIHHLGALDRGIENPEVSREPLRIVSCARVVPVKRLKRIVDALCLIKDSPIHWTHIGGGEGLESLKEYAAERLGANVTADFTGKIPNVQVYETYQQRPFHVFVNVSQSEGVPVSIMEAMSFHIPVIATAVGGTPELIEVGENGYLLPEEFEDEALAGHIRSFMEMPQAQYLSFRSRSREKFSREYDAIPNYRKFVEHLANISGKA